MKKRLAIFTAVAAILALAAGTTFALWDQDNTHDGFAVTNGQLKLAHTDTAWRQVTTSVPEHSRVSGPASTLAMFAGTTGDVIELVFDTETDVAIGKSHAMFTVTPQDSTQLPNGMTPRGWKLVNQSDDSVQPATGLLDFDDELDLSELTGNSGTAWSIVVTLEHTGDPTYTNDFEYSDPATGTAAFGFALAQQRTATGG